MERRSFLALLAAAPIAALAPLPTILEQRPRLTINHVKLNAIYKAMLMEQARRLSDVSQHRGYVRIMNTDGEIAIVPINTLAGPVAYATSTR